MIKCIDCGKEIEKKGTRERCIKCSNKMDRIRDEIRRKTPEYHERYLRRYKKRDLHLEEN